MSFTWINKNRIADVRRGVFLNMGTPHAVRMAVQLGFDWVLIDLEHGAGSEATLPELLMPAEGTPCSPIVRVVSNNQDRIKRALDLGAVGVMIPYVSTAQEAEAAAAYTHYPPLGCRGVAGNTVATGFGISVPEYHRDANASVTTIVQIETRQAIDNADAIAAVDGIDVLFVGPLDLSYNLGCPKQFDHADQLAAYDQVIAACRKHGKAPGILSTAETAQQHLQRGFTFVAVGSDSAALQMGLKALQDA